MGLFLNMMELFERANQIACPIMQLLKGPTGILALVWMQIEAI